MWRGLTILVAATLAGPVAACDRGAPNATRLVCDGKVSAAPPLCELFSDAVIEAFPDWQIAKPGEVADDELKLVIAQQDQYGIKAHLEWVEGQNARKIGREFAFSAMDRAISAGMAKGFLLRLLDYSKVSFGWD